MVAVGTPADSLTLDFESITMRVFDAPPSVNVAKRNRRRNLVCEKICERFQQILKFLRKMQSSKLKLKNLLNEFQFNFPVSKTNSQRQAKFPNSISSVNNNSETKFVRCYENYIQ